MIVPEPPAPDPPAPEASSPTGLLEKVRVKFEEKFVETLVTLVLSLIFSFGVLLFIQWPYLWALGAEDFLAAHASPYSAFCGVMMLVCTGLVLGVGYLLFRGVSRRTALVVWLILAIAASVAATYCGLRYGFHQLAGGHATGNIFLFFGWLLWSLAVAILLRLGLTTESPGVPPRRLDIFVLLISATTCLVCLALCYTFSVFLWLGYPVGAARHARYYFLPPDPAKLTSLHVSKIYEEGHQRTEATYIAFEDNDRYWLRHCSEATGPMTVVGEEKKALGTMKPANDEPLPCENQPRHRDGSEDGDTDRGDNQWRWHIPPALVSGGR